MALKLRYKHLRIFLMEITMSSKLLFLLGTLAFLISVQAFASRETDFLKPIAGTYQMKGDKGCESVTIQVTAHSADNYEVNYADRNHEYLISTDGQSKVKVTKTVYSIVTKEYSMMGNPLNTKKYSTKIVVDADGKLKSIESSYGKGAPLYLKDRYSIKCVR